MVKQKQNCPFQLKLNAPNTEIILTLIFFLFLLEPGVLTCFEFLCFFFEMEFCFDAQAVTNLPLLNPTWSQTLIASASQVLGLQECAIIFGSDPFITWF